MRMIYHHQRRRMIISIRERVKINQSNRRKLGHIGLNKKNAKLLVSLGNDS